jgi:hypothetical protein
MISSTGLNSVLLSNMIRRSEQQSPGDIELKLAFDDSKNCKVYDNVTSEEIGTGKLVEDGDAWGGKDHDVIHLAYEYLDAVNNEKHQVNDTLVIRDRGVVFEEFTVLLEEE